MTSIDSMEKIFANISQTYRVEIDRSYWFLRGLEALSNNNYFSLITQFTFLRGKEDNIRQPLRIAYLYAADVFLCTAIETFLLHCYVNSYEIAKNCYKNPTFSSLEKKLKKKMSLTQWNELSEVLKAEELRTLSMASLKKAQDLYQDIFGKDCFIQAIGNENFEWFSKQYQNLQNNRNGILHRGGEDKSGNFIDLDQAELESSLKKIQGFGICIAVWCKKRLLENLEQ